MMMMALTAFLMTPACRQTYDPPVISSQTQHLVVEGYINNGPDSTIITLTHTYKLQDTSEATPELHATVSVEGKDNSSFSLTETGKGNYAANLGPLTPGMAYRLHIKTSAGKEYVSDYVDQKNAPPIDSINWIQSDTGVRIFVNTHDPLNNTRYYRWDYEETWEFFSPFTSSSILRLSDTTVINRDSTNIFIYHCWHSQHSTALLLGSTAKLSTDLVYLMPLLTIPTASQQISVEYSILVRQYALSSDAYLWWQNLQKNNELTGSIFGVQPTTTNGNIHNVADTNDIVIGYIGVGTMQTKRIFIAHDQVNNWHFVSDCGEYKVLNDPDSLWSSYQKGELLTSGPLPQQGYWLTSTKTCVDCTLTGSNKKPAYWP